MSNWTSNVGLFSVIYGVGIVRLWRCPKSTQPFWKRYCFIHTQVITPKLHKQSDKQTVRHNELNNNWRKSESGRICTADDKRLSIAEHTEQSTRTTESNPHRPQKAWTTTNVRNTLTTQWPSESCYWLPHNGSDVVAVANSVRPDLSSLALRSSTSWPRCRHRTLPNRRAAASRQRRPRRRRFVRRRIWSRRVVAIDAAATFKSGKFRHSIFDSVILWVSR